VIQVLAGHLQQLAFLAQFLLAVWARISRVASASVSEKIFHRKLGRGRFALRLPCPCHCPQQKLAREGMSRQSRKGRVDQFLKGLVKLGNWVQADPSSAVAVSVDANAAHSADTAIAADSAAAAACAVRRVGIVD